MPDHEAHESRYEQVSRRTFLRRGAGLGLALAVPGVLLVACDADESAFADATSTVPDSADATTIVPTTIAPTTPATNADGAAPPGAEMTIEFMYEADSSSSRGVENPYLAVWIEDESGDLVATVALWFLQDDRGSRWLSDLRRWSTVDGSDATIDAISSATRLPGAYSLLWDCTDIDGQPISAGDYYVAIEAVRERGPYSLIRSPIAIGSDPFVLALDADGELTNASATYDLV